MVLRPRLTTGLPFSQSTKGGAPTQRVVMTETSGAVKGGTKGRAPALGAAVASIHPVAEKEGVPGNPYAAHRIRYAFRPEQRVIVRSKRRGEQYNM